MRFHRLLSYSVVFIFFTAIRRTNQISLKLKKRPYNSTQGFKTNVKYYQDRLKFYFASTPADYIRGKVDKNLDYYGEIQLGSPNKSFIKVSLDTSFSGFWVPSSTLTWAFNQKNSYKQSANYVQDIIGVQQTRKFIYCVNNNSILLKYMSVEGTLGFDSLWMDEVEIPGTHFLEANAISHEYFSTFIGDGVLGLGFPSDVLKMAPPLFTMLDRGALLQPEFSLFLGKGYDDGEITFGRRNSTFNKIQFHKLISKDSWKINIHPFFGKEVLSPCSCEALIDTGTALIAAPLKSLKSIYRKLQLKYTGEVTEIMCSSRSNMPSLNIKMGSQVISMNGYEYTIEINKKECVLGIMESPKEYLWILGNVFLSNVYTVFNVHQMEIGFALLK